MKLASLRSGRDGALVVVSRDLSKAVKAEAIAPTMQSALDNWAEASPALQRLYDGLNAGRFEGEFALDLGALAAPLPRAYQFLDGAAYASHIKRNRAARGETIPDDFYEKPLVYQGISHGFMAWNETVRLPSDDLGIDFEAEIFAVTDDVPVGVASEDASRHIKLFVLMNDISLRALIPGELKRTFGFLTGKPASSMGPIAVTPDELGELWDGKLVSGTMKCWVRGEQVGNIETGIDTPFHYGDLIAHVARTRPFEPGSLVGLGTVSNEDESAGCGCIGEIRALETLRSGSATTPLLRFGDEVRIEHFDRAGNSVFGRIQQTFAGLDH
ncbi:fumarylacetoacetate hydrolase family protein [Parapusillimonas granuli]|uniref:Fumarylacetoacetate hydrolase family protein n=1 Tax=Parapusillimonas granuli TaxID=380911 RepID=A0A853FUT1_9BURK|nr:fumarylacetoacetate hydrolase family protein [Parapusillimonas granuli]MBB5213515.1 fumarylacetoacetate (FAA) hydrolase [Parapusillimonas granuli]MEB2398608.1 fumarylacetoacetate hydrolase family protein [Alcaligenaceae bacterium]NYT48353.1 fumarylacetoacetate hydrolase family protein [Parapusillimonas granuli]